MMNNSDFFHNLLGFDNLRYERKFFMEELNEFDIERIVKTHPAIFREIYPPRFINNMYFDSLNMANYLDTISGISNRFKMRIRWYGSFTGESKKAALELKIRRGYLMGKIIFPLDKFCLGTDLGSFDFRKLFRASQIPEKIKIYAVSTRPFLVNRYRRKYFLSSDRKYRITIDSSMATSGMLKTCSVDLDRATRHRGTVLELKYSREFDDYAETITGSFPFAMTKSSKYVMGLEGAACDR